MFKLLKDRWTADTPRFFKRIVKAGCAVGATGLTCVPFNSSLPPKLQAIPGYLIAIGLASAGIARLTKEDPDNKAASDAFLNQNKQ